MESAPTVSVVKYPKTSDVKKRWDEQLAIFAGCTSFAYPLVESAEFQNFVNTLDPHYDLPCRKTLKNLVQRAALCIRNNIKDLLKDSEKVAIWLDLWTQKNMVAFYLAVTARFFSFKTGKEGGEHLFSGEAHYRKLHCCCRQSCN